MTRTGDMPTRSWTDAAVRVLVSLTMVALPTVVGMAAESAAIGPPRQPVPGTQSYRWALRARGVDCAGSLDPSGRAETTPAPPDPMGSPIRSDRCRELRRGDTSGAEAAMAAGYGRALPCSPASPTSAAA